jgi:NTP pyrophosphatase (non-canonical NTP hydrolase)
MSEVISLDASPIRKTTAEDVLQNLEDDKTTPAKELCPVQAQERIARLSEEVRALADDNAKLKSTKRHNESRIAELKGWIDERNLQIVHRDEQIIKLRNELAKIDTSEPTEESAEPESTFDYVTRYATLSQEYSNFYESERFIPNTTEHFLGSAVSLAEEFAELAEEKDKDDGEDEASPEAIKEELGDVCWAVAMMCDALSFPMQDLVARAMSKQTIMVDNVSPLVMKLLGHARKVHFHAHATNREYAWATIISVLKVALFLCDEYQWSFCSVLQGNLDKNKNRYPSGRFTSFDSINRTK